MTMDNTVTSNRFPAQCNKWYLNTGPLQQSHAMSNNHHVHTHLQPKLFTMARAL